MATRTTLRALSSSEAPGTGKGAGGVANAPLGPGPGSQLLHALTQHWGSPLLCQSRPVSTPIVLPYWWQLLRHAGDLPPRLDWTAQWAQTTPAGPWAPNALALLTQDNGGTLAVELDPNDENQRPAWWKQLDTLMLVANDLQDLAYLLERGPKGLEKLVSTPHGPTAPPVPDDQLPFDPITRQWQSHWTQPMDVFEFQPPGQRLTLTSGWTRHPTRPLLALPRA